jgi:hypothetical protein
MPVTMPSAGVFAIRSASSRRLRRGEARLQFLQLGAFVRRRQRRRVGIVRMRRRLDRRRREPQQQVARLDDLAGPRQHLGDRRIGLGADLVLHLHRLDDEQQRAACDRLPRHDGDLDDGGRHRRRDVCLHGVISSRRL